MEKSKKEIEHHFQGEKSFQEILMELIVVKIANR